MKIQIPSPKKARIEMLPLIDIVFLLLSVFIYAMLSMAVHRGLPIVLPRSTSAEIDNRTVLSVTAKTDGTVYVERQLVGLDGLKAALILEIGQGQDPGIQLFAEPGLSYQQLFQVLDQIRGAGIQRIALQAEMGHEP